MVTKIDSASAWLLSVDHFTKVAVGEFEFIHIVDQPEYFSIPRAPEYCKHVILWNDNIVPVMSLSSWNSGLEQTEGAGTVAILVYKNFSGELLYAGVKLVSIPVLVKVNNDQACALPDSANNWNKISLSCFKSSNGDVVPILDVATLFLQTLTK